MKVMMKQCFVLILALLLAVSLLPVPQGVAADTSETVSYTHLTLPTKA